MNIFQPFLLFTGIITILAIIKDIENSLHKKLESGKVVQLDINPTISLSPRSIYEKGYKPLDGIENLREKMEPYTPEKNECELLESLSFNLTFFYNQNAVFVKQKGENYFTPIKTDSIITILITTPIMTKEGRIYQLEIVREKAKYNNKDIYVLGVYLNGFSIHPLAQFPELLLSGTPDYIEATENWFLRRFLKKLLKQGPVEIDENHLLKAFNLKSGYFINPPCFHVYDRKEPHPYRCCYKNKYFELSREERRVRYELAI